MSDDTLADVLARLYNANHRLDLRLEDVHRVARLCKAFTEGGAVEGWRAAVASDRRYARLTGAWTAPVRWQEWSSNQYRARKGCEGRWQRLAADGSRWENCEPPAMVKDAQISVLPVAVTADV